MIVICDLKSFEHGIKLILNSRISQYINVFDVIQIGGDSLFQDIFQRRVICPIPLRNEKSMIFLQIIVKTGIPSRTRLGD